MELPLKIKNRGVPGRREEKKTKKRKERKSEKREDKMRKEKGREEKQKKRVVKKIITSLRKCYRQIIFILVELSEMLYSVKSMKDKCWRLMQT